MAKGASWTIHETGSMGIPRFDLIGKTAIVTGAGGPVGIGRAIARTFAAYGAKVVIADLNESALADRVAEIQAETPGAEVLGVRCDITNEESREALVQAALDAFAQIDILVNVAGVSDPRNLLAVDMDEETWDRVVDTNLKAMFFLSQRVAQHMIERERGNIINMSSFTARVASPRLMPYMAAKAGVQQMTRGMALEWGRYNIRVNCICPGYTQSAMTEGALKAPGGYETITRQIPYNRKIADPMDVAAAALFLACDASDMVDGTSLFVDGGRCVL